MSDLVTQPTQAEIIEQVVISGDLARLTPAQRVEYYNATCRSLGLNPLTRPFDYITLNGKLTLYARKDAADQLRQKKNISIGKPEIQFQDDWIIVTVIASDMTGRTDSDLGVVNRKDMRGDFGNALMKAVTKAKRRVTLSICGLGMLDETEIETIPDAKPVLVTDAGEIARQERPALAVQLPRTVEPPAIPQDAPDLLPYAVAAAVKSSDGTPYGDLPTDKWPHMLRSVEKSLAEGRDLPADQLGKLEHKRAALRTLIAGKPN